MAHTPTKAPLNITDWRTDHSHPLGYGHVVIWGGADGEAWVVVYGPSEEYAKGRAEEIVKAVNCHDELVKAAKSAIGIIESEWGACEDGCDVETDDSCTFCRLRAAIAKAEA